MSGPAWSFYLLCDFGSLLFFGPLSFHLVKYTAATWDSPSDFNLSLTFDDSMIKIVTGSTGAEKLSVSIFHYLGLAVGEIFTKNGILPNILQKRNQCVAPSIQPNYRHDLAYYLGLFAFQEILFS